MNVLIVSANNVLSAKHDSTSSKAGAIISYLLLQSRPQATVKIVSLLDFDLKSCVMCGTCSSEWKCVFDDDYNSLLLDLKSADAVFLVIPYYAPIPSKLSIVLEKVQEMCFIQMCTDKTVPYFLKNKVAALLVHGGSPKEYLSTYKLNLLDPVSSALRGVGMRLVGVGSEWPNGVAFGITAFETVKDSVFPRAVHDWVTIASLVDEVVYILESSRRG